MDKNKNLSSKNNRAFVTVMIILIILIVSIFCCFNYYRRRQRHQSLSFSVRIEQIPQEPSLLDTDQSASSSGPQLWVKTKRRWKNFRTGLPSYNHARTTQNITTTTSTVIPSEQPPSYEGIVCNTFPVSKSTLFLFYRSVSEHYATDQYYFEFLMICLTQKRSAFV